MTQNIYDDATFFAGYSKLPRSVAGLDAAPEWPSLRALLPALRGRDVLDLGCGFGWFCRWAREQGAARVLGIDLSAKMLARAAATTTDAAVRYERADLEKIELAPGDFDLAYSSLALHYIADLARLLAQVRRALRAGGAFVFSVEHPIYTAPADPAWRVDAAGHKAWPLNNYLDEGPRRTDWLAPGVIKQHRSVASYVNALLSAGFVLTHLTEWGPTPEQIAAHPEWADEHERPPFLIVAAAVS